MLPGKSVRRLVLIGLLAWAAGVPAVRGLALAGLLAPGWRGLLFATTIPVAWGAVWAIGRANAAEPLLPRLAILCMPALLLDAAVLGAAPFVYGPSEVQTAAGAYLLWFVGCTFAAGLATRSLPLVHQE